MIFCSVVMVVVSIPPRRGASPPRPLRAPPRLSSVEANAVIADKAFDADACHRATAKAGKRSVIPPDRNRKHPRNYDRDLYKERHLIENFFCKLKQYRVIA